jgi:hypothetical protein
MATPVDPPSRPTGITLTALIFCAFALISFVSSIFQPETSGRANLTSQYLPGFVSSIFLLCIALFAAWNYWKGKEWARAFFLVAAFLIAAEEISKIVDHDGSVVVVMSHPILFFRFIAALFLLYWLNTRPLRAWFKNTPPTAADLISDHLAGKLCTAIDIDSADCGWHFAFEHDAELILNCPWRIALDDNLAYASNFGEGTPADEEQPRQLLQNLRVKGVRVAPHTSDLFVTFEMGIELQTWSVDRNAQQWKFSDPELTVVADSVGLNSKAIVESNLTKDSAAND